MRRQRFRHAAPRRSAHSLLLAACGLVLIVAGVVVLSCSHRATAPGVAETMQQRVDGNFAWPADLTLVTVAGVDLPVSATAGPRDLADGRAHGFSQTPTGAVLAALHLLVRSGPQVGPGVWEPTLREQVVGPDVAAYAETVQLVYGLVRENRRLPYGAPLGPFPATIRGVRVDTSSALAADIRLLVEGPRRDGTRATTAIVVQTAWADADWRLVAPPNGDWANTPASADGFTPLPGR